MAINLHTKYAKEIASKYVRESMVAGRLDSTYTWAGAKTVKISTPTTVALTDYTRSGANRYGSPVEMQDVVQELSLSQDKSFALTIDRGNNQDQSATKEAGRVLALQLAEQAVPALDKYVLARLCALAGKIVGTSSAYTKSTIAQGVTAGTTTLDDAEVPADGRTLFVSSAIYALLRLSDEFQKCERLLDKSLSKGVVGTYDGMEVVKVPSGRWPACVNFLIVHKNAATAPVKLSEARVHKDPPGISGNLLEGRQYYDCFVYGARSGGVYVDIDTSASGYVLGAPTIVAQTSGTDTKGDFKKAAADSAKTVTFKYTTDGSDPRYSSSAKIGTECDNTAAGTVCKCYCYLTTPADGTYDSAVATLTF